VVVADEPVVAPIVRAGTAHQLLLDLQDRDRPVDAVVPMNLGVVRHVSDR